MDRKNEMKVILSRKLHWKIISLMDRCVVKLGYIQTVADVFIVRLQFVSWASKILVATKKNFIKSILSRFVIVNSSVINSSSIIFVFLVKQAFHYQLSARARKVDNKNWVSFFLDNAYITFVWFLFMCFFLLRIFRMDSFVQCAAQMLKELRILLQNTPIVLTTLRLVQLMALNIFAIDSTQQKGKCIWFFL